MHSSKPKGKNFNACLKERYFSDAIQYVKMEEHVRELESQLKDMYKGQIGNNQEVIRQVKENKELGEKVRELEKKTQI